MKKIYFDNAGTTKVFDETAKDMMRILTEDYYNPSALYSQNVKAEIESAREYIAEQIGVSASEIIFTSGATEADNWALLCGQKNKNGNVVISDGEHSAIYETAGELKSKGIEVRYAPLDKTGKLDYCKFAELLDENTSLVSIICCSNETGAVNDLTLIKEMIDDKCKRALFHSDCVQALCKVPFDYSAPDMMSFSAHKLGGPKGIGAFAIKKGLKIKPLITGGGQEKNMRSGTENCAGIVGFASAIKCFNQKIDRALVKKMKLLLKQTLIGIDGVNVHDAEGNSDFILSASVCGIKSEILQHLMYDDGFVIGLGSACSARTGKNRVLKAMGIPEKEIEGNIRISFGCDNTMEQVETLCDSLVKNIKILKEKLR